MELSEVETRNIYGGTENRWSYYVGFAIGAAIGTSLALAEDVFNAINGIVEEM